MWWPHTTTSNNAGVRKARFMSSHICEAVHYQPPDTTASDPERNAMTILERAVESPMAVYRRHLARGELAYQYSSAAAAAVFYPRLVCPFTGSDRLEWRVSRGFGTVYAVTVVHAAKDARHNVVLVDLDEGFRLLSRVDGLPPESVRIGLRVKVRIHIPANADEEPYPVFEPLAAG